MSPLPLTLSYSGRYASTTVVPFCYVRPGLLMGMGLLRDPFHLYRNEILNNGFFKGLHVRGHYESRRGFQRHSRGGREAWLCVAWRQIVAALLIALVVIASTPFRSFCSTTTTGVRHRYLKNQSLVCICSPLLLFSLSILHNLSTTTASLFFSSSSSDPVVEQNDPTTNSAKLRKVKDLINGAYTIKYTGKSNLHNFTQQENCKNS